MRSAKMIFAASVLLLVCPARAFAVEPTVVQMMKISPAMEGAQFEESPADDWVDYRLRRIERESVAGWLLLDADSMPLRRFIDTNGDKKIDRWIYYRDGSEVYRDVDTDYDGVADKAVRTYSLSHKRSGRLVAEESAQVQETPVSRPEPRRETLQQERVTSRPILTWRLNVAGGYVLLIAAEGDGGGPLGTISTMFVPEQPDQTGVVQPAVELTQPSQALERAAREAPSGSEPVPSPSLQPSTALEPSSLRPPDSGAIAQPTLEGPGKNDE